MSDDDIDIVEHNPLDNPLVRRMFPDLSIFKTETFDFNEVQVGNEPERYKINEEQRHNPKITNEETNAYMLSCPWNPTDKVYLSCVGHKEHKGSNNTPCYEVAATNPIMKKKRNTTKIKKHNETIFNIGHLSSLVIEKNLTTTNLCKEKVIKHDILLRSPRLVELLTRESVFPKCKKNQHPKKVPREPSVLQNENSVISADCTFSANPKPVYVENQQFDQRKKPEQLHYPLKKSISPLNSSGIIIGSKHSVKHANKKVSDILNQSRNVKVVLEDLKTFLSKSSRYCKICCRLFPSNKTLADHKSLIHQSDDHPLNKITVGKIEGNLKHNIQSQSVDKLNTEVEYFKCTHCDLCLSPQQLIDHMYNVIQNNNKDIKKSGIQKRRKSHVGKRTSPRIFYRCSLCLCYYKQQECFIKHVKEKHRKKCKFLKRKVAFDPICKICSTKYCDVNSFNVHVRKNHLKERKILISTNINSAKKSKNKKQMIKLKGSIQRKLNKHRNDFKKNETVSAIINSQANPQNQYLLKSGLFKCLKCDICFLSASKAVDHAGHMDILINWKCLKCSRIFKKEDELLHTHQHLFTDTFDVYEIKGIGQLAVLYKCPNCITYFLEKDIFGHYSVCEMRSPVSEYCKICHNLIDYKIKDLHDIHHKQLLKSTELNILFVESEFITYNENHVIKNLDNIIALKNKSEQKRGVLKLPTFTYCITCRCFVRRTRNLYDHTKDRCSHVVRYVCRFCGLILSNKSINFHRKLHKYVPGLTLHDFTFYDLKTGKVICPPVPKYPNCNKCGKHFITKTAIISHQCSEAYLTCPVCKIKLSKTAFPLHASFHNYTPKQEEGSYISNNPTVLDLPPKSKVHPSEVITNLISLANHSKIMIVKYKRNAQRLVYFCKNCKIAFDVYDKVIEHCQDHISGQEKEIITKPCDMCNVIFDVTCFDYHSLLHVFNRDKKFVVLSFDVFYATSEHSIWLNHLFDSVPKELVRNILESSIYKYECRVKLKVVQDGLKYLTYYKCAKCKKHVNSMSIYKHCQMGILCFKSERFQCSFCGIQFVCDEYLKKHEKIHEQQNVTIKSYRIVLFNCDEDKSINHALSLPNEYILYECRNCNGIVDKTDFVNHKCDYEDLAECSHCGLLICTNDYLRHILKHKEFCSFNGSNIKIILIGQINNSSKFKNKLVPSFRGIRLDYLLYQCNKCQVCVKDKESSTTHNCVKDVAMTKCTRCELYIDDSKFRKHRKFHEDNRHFLKENITVVKFGFTKSTSSDGDDDVILIEDEDDSESITYNILERDKLQRQRDIVIDKTYDLFKCKCGLHFLYKEMAFIHCAISFNPNPIKQMCTKCGLDFLPSVLYSHLLSHHGPKNISSKFNIIEMS